jgi:hypothetical protein
MVRSTSLNFQSPELYRPLELSPYTVLSLNTFDVEYLFEVVVTHVRFRRRRAGGS